MNITIELPDGTKREFQKGVSGMEIAESIGKRLAQDALAIEINGETRDLSTKISDSARIRILTFADKGGKRTMWHSAEHILQEAMTRMFPGIKMAMGPATDEGFYFDFDAERTFSPADFPAIEEEMRKIVAKNEPFIREEVSPGNARHLFAGNPYKEDWIQGIEKEGRTASIYRTGNSFVDLCAGPHVPSTGKVKALKLLKTAGAYWHGDSKNKMLQRIYGIAFPEEKQLKEYLHMIEEAEKRDHRKLGKELELFSIHDEGPGFPFFLPKGVVLKNELIKFWREIHRKEGYVEIQTPIMLNRKLWETSKHWYNYKENMYTTVIDGEDYAIKPMNCPGGILVYKEKVHSYKELPLRVGELGIVHRHELSGVLSGLFRVRVFTQDDAHIYMTPEQMKGEVFRVMDLFRRVYSMFGFEYHVELSTRPKKSTGTDEMWELTTSTLKQALEEKGMPYKINEGDGAFYGPKIDFHLKDALGRTWQCGTIQLDMGQPENFDLKYMGEDGSMEHRPVMLHRVVYGSLERFMGILIEHYAGRFPLWLAPVQVKIMTISDKFNGYGKKLYEQYSDAGIRVEFDDRTESINKKVRDAQLERVPVMLTVGEKEEAAGTVALRTLDGKVKFGMNPDELLRRMNENISHRESVFEI